MSNSPYDGTMWDVNSPANGDDIPDAPREMRDIRIGVATRINKEHVTLATSSAGGEHRQGSAKVYAVATEPGYRPDDNDPDYADTALGASDAGRLWLDTDTDELWYYTGSAWKKVNIGGVNSFDVTLYGATGDGATDDQAAIQSALDAANTAGGGVVFFPPGVYVVESQLVTYDNITMLGYGWSSIIERKWDGTPGIRPTNATLKNENALSADADPGPPVWVGTPVDSNIAIIGLTFRTTSGTAYDGCHICIHSCDGLLIHQVNVTSVQNESCFAIIANNFVISDCNLATTDVDHSAGANTYADGIHIHGGYHGAITNCVVDTYDDGIVIASNLNLGAADIQVSNCKIDATAGHGLLVASTRANASDAYGAPTEYYERIQFSNCSGYVAQKTVGAIQLRQDGHTKNLVRDIHFENCHFIIGDYDSHATWSDGVSVMRGVDVSFTDCSIDNPYRRGFHFYSGDDVDDAERDITAVSWSANVATITMGAADAHRFETGDVVYVSGVSIAAYNGEFTVTATGTYTLSYALVGDPGVSPTTGIVAVRGKGVKLTGCKVKNLQQATLYACEVKWVENISFENCEFDCSGSAGGMKLWYNEKIRIQGNSFLSLDSAKEGIFLNGKNLHVQIQGNFFEGSAAQGIESGAAGNTHLQILGNDFTNIPLGSAIVLTATPTVYSISGNISENDYDGVTLTESSDAITLGFSEYYLIAGEGAAADNLVTINGGWPGRKVYLSASDTDVTITARETGNLALGSTTRALDNSEDILSLIFNGTSWCELSFANNGA